MNNPQTARTITTVIPANAGIQDKDLPDGWILATIDDLISPDGVFIDGDWVESKDQDPNGEIRLIQLADIGDGYYKDKSDRFLTKEKALELNCTFLEKGDVLIARMPDPLGRACVFPGDAKESVTVVDVCVVRAGSKDVDHKWLMYWINSPKFRNAIAALQSGTTRKRISRGNLATIKFPVPPPDQQKLIVAKIEELFPHIDAGIYALKKAKQLLKQYRQSVLKAAVTGELTREWREANKDKLEPASKLLESILKERRQKWEDHQLEQFKAKGKIPKDDKWRAKYKNPVGTSSENECVEIPEEWIWSTVDQLGDVRLGRQRSPKNRSKEYPTKYIRAANLTEEGLDFTDLLDMEFKPEEFARYVMKPNDLILSEASGSPDQVGKPAIWKAGMPVCCFQNTVIRHRPNRVESEYLLVHYKYYYWCRVFSKTAGGVGINHISAQKFLKMSIALPPLLEQKEVVKKVDQNLDVLGRLHIELDSQMAKAERNKQSILASVFSGILL